MNYSEIIAENKKRRMSFTEPYDPVTGEGSDVIPRKEIKIEEFGTLHIPADMYEENGWVQILAQEKSYKNLLENHLHQRATPQLIREIDRQFFLLRIKYDFEFWAIATVTIKDKMTSVDIPFLLNKSQRKLLKLFEQQRRAGKPIRVILLKSRQWGGSTLTQIYMAWIQLVHKHQWNSVIAAHHKDSSLNIKAMYTKLLDNYPAWILNSPLKFKPFERTQNVYYIPQVSARVTIGSAEKPNSVRGSDIAMAHFSEVALYEDTCRRLQAAYILFYRLRKIFVETRSHARRYCMVSGHEENIPNGTANEKRVPVRRCRSIRKLGRKSFRRLCRRAHERECKKTGLARGITVRYACDNR